MDALDVAPRLTASFNLKAESTLQFSLYVPAASDPVSHLELCDGDTVLATWDNHGTSTSAWQTVQSFPMSVGRHNLLWSASPAGGEPFRISQLSVAGETIDLARLAAAQVLRASGATATTQDFPINYFTSFDATLGGFYFLELIPWLTSAYAFAPAPEQSSAQALTGPYSAKLTEGLLDESFIKGFATVPFGVNQVLLSVWLLPLTQSGVKYNLSLDGNTIQSGTWSFAPTDLNRWVLREAFIPVIPIQDFTFWYQLSPATSNPSANVVYSDNLSLAFQLTLPPYVEKLIDTDTSGAVYAVDRSTGANVWTFQCSNGYVTSAPAVVNGCAYFADGGGVKVSNMYCVNADTGETPSNWTQPMQGSCTTTPQFDETGTYVATSAGLLYGFNTLTGAQLFEPINFMNLGANVFVAVNGLILTANGLAYLSAENGVYAVSIALGTLVWKTATAEIPWEVALSEEGAVFAGCVDGSLYCLDGASGNPIPGFGAAGKFNAAGPINCTPQIVGGVVLFGCDAGVFYCLDTLTGAQFASLAFTGAMVRSFTMNGTRLYVVGNLTSATIYAYDISIDDTTWTFASVWQFGFSLGADMPPVPDGDFVYLTANNRNLYALAALDGKYQWSHAGTRIGLTAPSVVYYDPLTTLNRRYDQYCYLTTHNAYASTSAGWAYAQQTFDLPMQLRDGVRGLMLDIFVQQVNGEDQIVFCHESCNASYLIQPFSRWPLLIDALTQIGVFLTNNPNEVVTIIFEQRLGRANTALLMQAFNTAGLQNSIFLANQTNQGTSPTGQPVTWDVSVQGWPTLSWMVSNNKRLVLFSDWNTETRGGGNQDGCPWIWDWCVENEYGNASLAGGCVARSGSQPLNSTEQSLFIMNYFPTSQFGFDGVKLIERMLTNSYYSIMPACNTCTGLANRLPNFIAVDYYQFGLYGGPSAVVNQLNAAWALVP